MTVMAAMAAMGDGYDEDNDNNRRIGSFSMR